MARTRRLVGVLVAVGLVALLLGGVSWSGDSLSTGKGATLASTALAAAQDQPDRAPAEGEGRRPEQPDRPPVERLARERTELQRAAETIRRELRELGDRQPERREALVRKLEALERELGEIGRPPAPPERPDRPRPGMAVERIRQRIAELEEQIAKAERAGEERRLGALRAELGRLREMMARMEGGRDVPPGPPRELPPEERERRLHHLRAAIENLHAAGFPELARRVEEVADRVRAGQPVGIPPGPPEGVPPAPPVPAEIQRIGEAVRELLGRTEKLARRMEELAERIGRLEARTAELKAEQK